METTTENQNEQDMFHVNAIGVDHDIQLTNTSLKKENIFNSTKTLPEVQMPSSQSKQQENPKLIEKEHNLPLSIRESTAYNTVDAIPLKKTKLIHEISETHQMTGKKLSFDENGEISLKYSFFTIRRYFDALPSHVVLSFLLASKNVCESFAILSTKDRLDYLEKCYLSINAYSNLPSDTNNHKLRTSTLKDERDLLICYLIVKIGGIQFTNVIKLLKLIGICIQVYEYDARMYFKNFCKYVKCSKKGFLDLKPPYISIRRFLQNKDVSEFSPSDAWFKNYLCFNIPNESKNVNSEMIPISSRDLYDQPQFSTKFEIGKKAENEACSGQKIVDAKEVPCIHPKQKPIKIEQGLSQPMIVTNVDNIMETVPFQATEIKHVVPETNQMTDKTFCFDENGEKLLEYSFFTIKSYFKDALSNHIILSFLLASKNVCKNFAILSPEYQLDYLERCYRSINTYCSLPSDCYNHELKTSIDYKRDLFICYLIVRTRRMHFTNVIKVLKFIGIYIQVSESAVRMYFRNICNYINCNKRRFLTLKLPFSRMRVKDTDVSVFFPNDTSNNSCPKNSLCSNIPNENKNINPEMIPSSSRDLYDQPKLSTKFDIGKKAENDSFSLNSLQSKQKPIKIEHGLSHPVTESNADSIVETIPFHASEIKHEASETFQMTDKKFSFDESGEKLLQYSFFAIRRYFKDAFLHHIILSFLLASKKVCENFAILSTKDQHDYLERCYHSINAYGSLPSDSYIHELNKSTFVEERFLIICYLAVKTGGIHYLNLLEHLKKTGICIQDWEYDKFIARMYFKNMCNYINFSRKGLLKLKPPFTAIKRSLRDMYTLDFSSNSTSNNACLENDLCFQIPNKNMSPKMSPSTSHDLLTQPKDSFLMIECDETAGKKAYLDQKVVDVRNVLSSQSKQKRVKMKQVLPDPVKVRKTDNIVETTPVKETKNKHETNEKSEKNDKKFFVQNWEKVLEYSFFNIRKHFKEALPYHIIVSFLLASKYVCKKFVMLSSEEQFDLLEKCYCSINAYDSSCPESNYHKLQKSTLVEEKFLIMCYIIVKSGGIHYRNLITHVKKTGIDVQDLEGSESVVKMYFKNISYINLGKKGFLTLKVPFIDINRLLKKKYVSALYRKCISSNGSSNYSSMCVQVPKENKNINLEMPPSSSQNLSNQPVDSLMFEVGERAEKRVCSDQVVKVIIDISVFILSISEKMHVEQLCNRISCTNLKKIQTNFSSLDEHEKLTFFKGYPQYFNVDTNGYVSLGKGVINSYEPKSEMDLSNLFINSCFSSGK